MNSFDIRNATLTDIPALLELEKSFVAPWKEEYLVYELKDNPVNTFLVVTYENEVVGFVDYWITFDSATISQIAIKNEFRHKGLARMLLKEMYDDCYAKRVRNITLEVRTSNKSAINLYEKYGFKTVITKPRYYDNGEDALYMLIEVK